MYLCDKHFNEDMEEITTPTPQVFNCEVCGDKATHNVMDSQRNKRIMKGEFPGKIDHMDKLIKLGRV